MTRSKTLTAGVLSCIGMVSIVSAASLAPPPGPPGPPGDPNLSFMPQDWPVRTIREGKVYVVSGPPSNATIIIGDKGVIVIDPKTTMATGQHLIKKIAALTPKPVTHVIETHSDCDHVNGVAAFPESVKIIAHVNNLKEQQQVARLATVEIDGGHGVAPQDRLPNVLITKNKETATINGVRFVFYHFAAGHTEGDLMIYLPDEKVMVAGDILMTSDMAGVSLPDSGLLFKFEKNASTAGWLKNAEGMLAAEPDADVYVPGHGDKVLTKPVVQKLLADFRAQMAKVDALAASGKSLAETTTEMGDRPFDPLANGLRPTTLKECPRGILPMSASWIRWHEWTSQHRGLEKMGPSN